MKKYKYVIYFRCRPRYDSFYFAFAKDDAELFRKINKYLKKYHPIFRDLGKEEELNCIQKLEKKGKTSYGFFKKMQIKISRIDLVK